MLESLASIFWQGRSLSLVREEFACISKARIDAASAYGWATGKSRLRQIVMKIQNKLRQRVLLRCAIDGLQVETFHRYSRTSILIVSSALPSVEATSVWSYKGHGAKPIFTTHLAETPPGHEEITRLLKSPCDAITAALAEGEQTPCEAESEQTPSEEGVHDHKREVSAWQAEEYAKRTIASRDVLLDTVEVKNEFEMPGQNIGSCWCAANCGANLHAADATLESPRWALGYESHAAPPAYCFIPRVAQHKNAPPASASSTTQPRPTAVKDMNELWRAFPWEVHVRLAPPETIGLRIGNAASRADDFSVLDSHSRMRKKMHKTRTLTPTQLGRMMTGQL